MDQWTNLNILYYRMALLATWDSATALCPPHEYGGVRIPVEGYKFQAIDITVSQNHVLPRSGDGFMAFHWRSRGSITALRGTKICNTRSFDLRPGQAQRCFSDSTCRHLPPHFELSTYTVVGCLALKIMDIEKGC